MDFTTAARTSERESPDVHHFSLGKCLLRQ
jgi:hypothetical protein